MTKDPVCGMEIDLKKALKATYKGKTHYVCSPACKKKFESNPELYVGKN